jgi:hypothetical protein
MNNFDKLTNFIKTTFSPSEKSEQSEKPVSSQMHRLAKNVCDAVIRTGNLIRKIPGKITQAKGELLRQATNKDNQYDTLKISKDKMNLSLSAATTSKKVKGSNGLALSEPMPKHESILEKFLGTKESKKDFPLLSELYEGKSTSDNRLFFVFNIISHFSNDELVLSKSNKDMLNRFANELYISDNTDDKKLALQLKYALNSINYTDDKLGINKHETPIEANLKESIKKYRETHPGKTGFVCE